MSEFLGVRLEDREQAVPQNGAPHSRAVGSPLSAGAAGRPHQAEVQDTPTSGQESTERRSFFPPAPPLPPAGQRVAPSPEPPPETPPNRSLGTGAPSEKPSGLQRALDAFRMVAPIVQRLLPLLDGNIGSAVSNFLTPHQPQHQQPAPPPQPKVDLVPLEDGLAALQSQHRDLCDQVMEQNHSLKRVEDSLEMVREATDRNTLEQQELLEDLRTFSHKVKIVAVVAIGLLALVLVVNVILYLHIQRVLP